MTVFLLSRNTLWHFFSYFSLAGFDNHDFQEITAKALTGICIAIVSWECIVASLEMIITTWTKWTPPMDPNSVSI
jgi:hypothetical protein